MKRHLFWIVELFIWLLILFLVSGGIMLAKYNYKKNFNTYQIFLPDVDGLINGSPVKILGIQVGYVNQIDIVGEDVYVKFIVTDKSVKIPHGSTATVEFSGLGGSKSLELYPPKYNSYRSDRLLTAQPPKRIHDSLGVLNNMFNKLINITYDVSHFMDQVGKIQRSVVNQEPNSQISADGFLNLSNKWLDKTNSSFDKFGNKLEDIKDGKKNGNSNGKNK